MGVGDVVAQVVADLEPPLEHRAVGRRRAVALRQPLVQKPIDLGGVRARDQIEQPAATAELRRVGQPVELEAVRDAQHLE
jgi:hypothetical protein